MDLAPLDTTGLDPRDAALAHAIYDAVMRRWITLGYLIEGFTSRSFGDLDARLRGVLLAGAAQLLLLDRVPPHAVLNESVDWTKRYVKPEAAGLVNAVLRRISELAHGQFEGIPQQPTRIPFTGGRDQLPFPDGTAIVLRMLAFPADPIERLALSTSHPVGMVQRWAKELGEAEASRMALHSLCIPPTILNTQFAREAVAHAEPHLLPGHQVFRGSRSQLVQMLDSRRDVWVQDPASAFAVADAASLTPSLIVDLCAGQGTKTRQLACTFPDARIIATDVDERRLAALRTAARHHANIHVIPSTDLSQFNSQADLLLLDVPCSNSGVFPRRPEARYRSDRAQFDRLIALQRQIVEQSLPLLSSFGTMLYSTCSIEADENEAQAEWATNTLHLKAATQRRTSPAGLPGGPDTSYHDGAFSVHLQRA